MSARCPAQSCEEQFARHCVATFSTGVERVLIASTRSSGAADRSRSTDSITLSNSRAHLYGRAGADEACDLPTRVTHRLVHGLPRFLPQHASPPPGDSDSNGVRVVRHSEPSGGCAGRCAARCPRDVARNLPVVQVEPEGGLATGPGPDASARRPARSRRSIALAWPASAAHAPDSWPTTSLFLHHDVEGVLPEERPRW
jgi:hypothetical protein